jgi:hypothetical protein
MGVVDTSTFRGHKFFIQSSFGVLDTPLESSNREEIILTCPHSWIWNPHGPQIPQKLRLGTQNGPKSLEPETLQKHCQGGKLFFEPVE